ncbi:succinylglutamate desuccinylase/aspartoacylase family protein [Candidatus Nanosalina sp. VS9-1]|uniref:succinylglutamate desuccinylase/aspartoacylase domain-containing protein n=1 Tax=Candidatus Nanosalina sp. VS9-1 TaxID=3388566 RepID=UPI0039DFF822
MKIYKRGEGEPEITVVGSVHGDEPAGRDAIENFLDENHEFLRPVQFIIANEEALEKDVRFLDTDLNRVFPGDSESESHEERLASEIMSAIEGTKVLDLHTTRSYPQPFATFTDLNDTTRHMLAGSGVKNAVHFPEQSGTLHEQVDGIVVETGHQGTPQARRNAEGVIKNFLAAQDVLDIDFEESDPVIFRYYETVEGDWQFLADNFKKVEKGEVFAERDGEKLEASESFYPVLMSTDGYEGMLGFKARKLE